MRSTPSPAAAGRRPRNVLTTLFLAGLLVAGSLVPFVTPPAEACLFSQPPPPFCGKSLHIASAVPRVHLLPGGGVIDVSALLYFTMVDFPAGSGICPAGPYTADVDVTVTCTPGPGGSGSVVAAPITLGFNELTVPVTVGAGTSRMCSITIKSTVTLGDGMVLTATSDSKVCLAEPAPDDAGLPRLDLELVGGPGDEIVRVHPGDQGDVTYRLTNNDPEDSFTGRMVADSVNVARLPGASGPMPPGTGVFSISDPVQGDNFPLAYAEDLFEGCVLLPEDPANPAVPTRQRDITLAPGESIDIDIYTRSWGMCADGSCSRSTVQVDGEFSDLSTGLACAGFISAAETAVAPTYGWPDAGDVAEASSSVPGSVQLAGEPRPAQGRIVTLFWLLISLLIDDVPEPTSPLIFSDTVMPELGRTQVQWNLPKPFPVDSVFDIEYQLTLGIAPPVAIELVELDLLGEIPTGFADIAPS
ncbi:MAG: hypothetical protein AAFY88_13235, partial [Acidobacteriota bacterium]